MGLRLHQVAPRQGWRWFQEGMRLFFRKPLPFAGLFLLFLLGVLLVMSVPVVGGLLGLGLMPLLTYAFMAASRGVRAGEQVSPAVLFEAFDGSRAQRVAMLQLCVAYALGSVLTLELANWVDGGAFERLQVAMAGGAGRSDEAVTELANPALGQGMLVRFGIAALMSVPFWFAPALVRWGDQSAWQSLFSSTLALWRAKGAFMVYSIAWLVAVVAVSSFVAMLAMVLGLGQLVTVLAVPIGLIFSTAFYVSLWFSWRDCFGGEDDDEPVSTLTLL